MPDRLRLFFRAIFRSHLGTGILIPWPWLVGPWILFASYKGIVADGQRKERLRQEQEKANEVERIETRSEEPSR